MIVQRLRVRRFRKLRDQELRCGAGLNVIRGPNDAGKSTLHLAFGAAFYRVRAADALFSPWGEDRPGELEVEFEADGAIYRLRKDFAARRATLSSPSTSIDTPEGVERRCGELLGLPTLGQFRATLHVGQWELAALEKDQQREIGTRLSQIMTGGDSDAARVLKDLDERIKTLERGLDRPVKAPGPIKSGQDQVTRLSETQQRLSTEVAEIERVAAERDRLAATCTDLEKRVADDEALLDANRRLLGLDRQVEEARRRATELTAILTEADTAVRASAAVRAVPAPDPERVQAVRRADVLVEERRKALADAQAAAAAVPRAAGASGTDAAAARIGWILSFVAAAAGLAGMAAGPLLPGAVLVILAVASGAWLYRRHRRAAAHGAEVERAEIRAADAAAAVAARSRDLAAADTALREGLAALGAASTADVLALLTRSEESRRAHDAAQNRLEGLLRGRTREALADESRAALVDLGAAQAQRDEPALAAKRLDPAAFQRRESEARRRRVELEEMKGRLRKLEGRLDARSPYEQLGYTEQDLAEAQSRLDRVRRHAQVLRLARDVLAEAHRETIVPGRALLERHASEYVRALSDGAYQRISVDADTLAPRVWIGPPREWADVDRREIGTGGVAQCYLALRLALVDVLCGGRRPPLFLDDPLLAYDDGREAAAMALLRRLAVDRQIFLFTCRTVYDAYADHLVVLGGGPPAPDSIPQDLPAATPGS
ncbi:MAG TPA: AAA family ATPase [bacterium]|nr:AAA family ATPase [bacterium]